MSGGADRGGDIVLWEAATSVNDWRSNAADGSTSRLSVEASALCFDFTLAGHGACAIARRELSATLPSHYAVVVRLHGAASPCELQLKLVDPSGTNVWWWRRPKFQPPSGSEHLVFHKASLE